MPKFLNFTQNILGVFALFGIIVASTFVTVGLSPIAVAEEVLSGEYKDGNLAGVSTTDYPEIVSNFVPLEITDLTEPSPRYTSQLVKNTDEDYNYNVRIASQDKGVFGKKMIKVLNPNSAPVVLQASVSVPADVESSLHIAVTGEETYRIHDANNPGVRVVSFELDAGEELGLTLEYEYLHNILFPIDVSYRVSY